MACLGAAASLPAAAADWSDTSISWRYGTNFREPYVNRSDGSAQNISKNIVNLQHTSGYKYGVNWASVDLLMSDHNDPASCTNFNCTGSAHEAYVLYRNHIEWGKVFPDRQLKLPGIKDVALTLGFDWNTKNDAGYSSKKRMFVWGPTLELNVPGYMNVGLYGLNESNAPCTTFPPAVVGYPPNACYDRYSYKTHAMLSSSWAIPIPVGGLPLSYEGYLNYIAPKGSNEFGGSTRAEINWDSQIMLDVGALTGGSKGTFKLGIEYQYWRNKFGNDHNGGAGPGAFARTTMVRAEYHF
ncbi:outer envelope protein [Caenimonas sp. DR4.4]|uniref:Outer envelope protein n=1 Tax=Caenimonas aquaedulcis TaxID=2793270 RepID=A0A931H7W1_9BURK|nr:outer envelope protein [Caenimonas aquaedulcis]